MLLAPRELRLALAADGLVVHLRLKGSRHDGRTLASRRPKVERLEERPHRHGALRQTKRRTLESSPSPVCIMPFDVYFYMRAERSRFRTSDLAAVLEPTKCAGSRIGNYYVRHNCLAAHIFDRRVLSLGDYAFRPWDPRAKMCSAHAGSVRDDTGPLKTRRGLYVPSCHAALRSAAERAIRMYSRHTSSRSSRALGAHAHAHLCPWLAG